MHGWLYACAILLVLPSLILGLNVQSAVFNRTPDKKIQPGHVMSTHITRSLYECGATCVSVSTCMSFSFRSGSTTGSCILSNITASDFPLYTDAVEGWESFSVSENAPATPAFGLVSSTSPTTTGPTSTLSSTAPTTTGPTSTLSSTAPTTTGPTLTLSSTDWSLVFRAPNGIGGDVYESFKNSAGVTTASVDCNDLTTTVCQTNYRHTILDSWDTAGIAKVRFAFYKNQAEAAYVVFNAIGSNLTSWFTKQRILDSTWVTSHIDNYEIFALDGAGTTNRRFSMTRYLGFCYQHSMYSFAIVSNATGCDYDQHTNYPQFIYASTQDPGFPDSQTGTDIADFMAIFLKS